MDDLVLKALTSILSGDSYVVDACVYDALRQESIERDDLVKLVFNNTRLDYDKTGLRFDSETTFFEYLKMKYPRTYALRVKELHEQAERSNGDPV